MCMKRDTIISRSPEATHEVARGLLTSLPPGAVLALHGDLGSGKTCFVQGLAQALGVRKAVTSPTFTLINEYRGGERPLFHIDLYRLETPEAVDLLALEEYWDSNGITAIEWAERAVDTLPKRTIHLRFHVLPEPDSRSIVVEMP